MYGVLVWKSEGNRRLLRRLSWEGNIKMYLPEMGLGGTMLPAGGRQHRGCIIPQALTQSSAPEDGQNNFPKHAELTGITNKPLLLHLVGCLYYLYQ